MIFWTSHDLPQPHSGHNEKTADSLEPAQSPQSSQKALLRKDKPPAQKNFNGCDSVFIL